MLNPGPNPKCDGGNQLSDFSDELTWLEATRYPPVHPSIEAQVKLIRQLFAGLEEEPTNETALAAVHKEFRKAREVIAAEARIAGQLMELRVQGAKPSDQLVKNLTQQPERAGGRLLRNVFHECLNEFGAKYPEEGKQIKDHFERITTKQNTMGEHHPTDLSSILTIARQGAPKKSMAKTNPSKESAQSSA